MLQVRAFVADMSGIAFDGKSAARHVKTRAETANSEDTSATTSRIFVLGRHDDHTDDGTGIKGAAITQVLSCWQMCAAASKRKHHIEFVGAIEAPSHFTAFRVLPGEAKVIVGLTVPYHGRSGGDSATLRCFHSHQTIRPALARAV